MTAFFKMVSDDRIEQITRAVCHYFTLRPDELYLRRRFPRIVKARWCAMALMRDEGMTLSEIGREFACDHTTVIHGVKRVQQNGGVPAPIRARLA